MEEDRREAARRALDHARGLLSQGRPMEALRVMMDVLKRLRGGGGGGAALASASSASSAWAPSPPDPASFGPSDLAQLLEQVSLAAAPPAPPAIEQHQLQHEQQQQQQPPADGTNGGASVLAETGRGGVAGDALADGSSVVCGRCGGVIAARRAGQHAAWCSSGGGGGGEEDMED